MKMKFMALMLGAFALPTVALAGAGSYNASLYNAVNNAPTCNGVFNVATLQSSKPAGVTTVEMRHISDLSRSEQQQLADMKGSASLEAEFHLGSNNCWYMLLKTMSSGKTRTAVATTDNTNVARDYNFYTYRSRTTNTNTSNSTATTTAVSRTSDTFRVGDVNFALASVNVITAAPAEPTVTVMYDAMTEAQQRSLLAFYGSQANGATIYRTFDGMWHIML